MGWLLGLLGACGVWLLVLAFWMGDQQRKIDAQASARADLEICRSASDAQNTALDRLRSQLDEQRERHVALLAAAHTALDERDAAAALHLETARVRADDIRSPTHEPICALAGVPVCPVLAERLWPAAQGTDGDPTAHAH